MATELGLLSLTHLHKLAQSQDNQTQNQNQNQIQNHHQLNPNTLTTPSTFTTTTATTAPTPWMWNPKNHHHHNQDAEEDSWEVRAFAEDTGNVMGTTWPPRSYTCAFCRREFRSAQALGGHMNVHRRDRARLHQVMPPPNSIINHHHHPAATAYASSSSSSSSSFLIPAREFVSANGTSGGLCLVYPLPNPNYSAATFSSINPPTSTALNACTDHHQPSPSPSPSTLLSISPYLPGNLAAGGPRPPRAGSTSTSNYINAYRHRDEEPSDHSSHHDENGDEEDLDLELRLGHGPTPS